MTSALEQRFAWHWRIIQGPRLEQEVRLIEGRRYRCDFFHRPTGTVIELQGGIWQKGGHSTGTGITRDCEKTLAHVLAGYRVIHLTASMIDVRTLERIADFLKSSSEK